MRVVDSDLVSEYQLTNSDLERNVTNLIRIVAGGCGEPRPETRLVQAKPVDWRVPSSALG